MDTKTINLRDLPEELVRRAKACAALHGMTLKQFVTHAIQRATEADIPAVPLHMAALAGQPKRRKTRGERA